LCTQQVHRKKEGEEVKGTHVATIAFTPRAQIEG
jgi:hypothetical protein